MMSVRRPTSRFMALLSLGWVPTLAVMGLHWVQHDTVAAQSRAPITVTRLYTGADGKTHAEDIEVPMGAPRGATDRSSPVEVSSLQFVRTSPDYFLDWHNAPRRQYVVTLSGQSEVEIADGETIRLYPGRVLLVEDVDGQGHLSRAVPGEERVSLFLPITEP
jgi:hypothetical protein